MNIPEFLKSSTFWIAIGSIGTFFMALATYVTLRWNQKEKRERENREIAEKIIQPFIEKLKGIIEYIPKGHLPKGSLPSYLWQPRYLRQRWGQEKENNYYLILRMDQKINEKIKKFDEKWKKFKHLHCQQSGELNELFYLEILSHFRQQDSPEAQKALQILSRDFAPTRVRDVRNWSFHWRTGGKSFSKNFFELIFFNNTSLQKSIEESKNDPEILNRKISQVICLIEGLNVEIENWNNWDKIIDSIKKKINEDKIYREYFEYSREIYNEANSLKEELENFVKKIK